MTAQVNSRVMAGVWGLAVLVAATAAPAARAQGYQMLYTFTGGADGAYPYNTLVADTAGNLYGTALQGGANNSGVVFKLDANGTQTVLNNFSYTVDGVGPVSGVIRDVAGNLYGTVNYGGPGGWGSVFEINPAGAETVLYSFNEFIGDQPYPYAGVVRDRAGNLYGTDSGGALFKVSPTGVETILYKFTGGTDGATPFGGVTLDEQGNIYGTTSGGGNLATCGGLGCGVIFKVTPAGKESILHNFFGADGAIPLGGLTRDSAGNLYGTTYQGGAYNMGTVFKLDTANRLHILHSFAGGSDGANPTATLFLDAETGTLYGTTALGGAVKACPSGCGTVFKIAADGTLVILYKFSGPDGAYPEGGVTKAGGKLYGTAYAGGAYDAGVVFEIAPQ